MVLFSGRGHHHGQPTVIVCIPGFSEGLLISKTDYSGSFDSGKDGGSIGRVHWADTIPVDEVMSCLFFFGETDGGIYV